MQTATKRGSVLFANHRHRVGHSRFISRKIESMLYSLAIPIWKIYLTLFLTNIAVFKVGELSKKPRISSFIAQNCSGDSIFCTHYKLPVIVCEPMRRKDLCRQAVLWPFDSISAESLQIFSRSFKYYDIFVVFSSSIFCLPFYCNEQGSRRNRWQLRRIFLISWVNLDF